MSRKKTLLKKALRQAARGTGNTHDGRQPSVTGSHGSMITPRNAGGRFQSRLQPLVKG